MSLRPRFLQRPIYYGWILVPLACLCYGWSLTPAYHGWGQFAASAREDLGISEGSSGTMFGAIYSVFLLFYQCASILAAYLIARFGLRFTVTFGALLMATGLGLLSQATTVWQCFLFYAVLAGTGVSLSTVLPMQSLATFWFRKYRARVLAVILAGSTLAEVVAGPLNAFFLRHFEHGWRVAWQFYCGVSVVVAIIAYLFFRNRPEDLGQKIDGERDQPPNVLALDTPPPPPPVEIAGHQLTARQAILTLQFAIITLCSVAQAGGWSLYSAHGPLHFTTLGFSAWTIGWLASTKSAMSTSGRLVAGLGDFMSPRQLLAISLAIEGVGLTGLVFSQSETLAYAFVALFGLGHGCSFVCIPLNFAEIFGRNAFVNVAGTSRMVQGLITSALPFGAGLMADRAGSYVVPFVIMGLVCVSGAVGVQFCRPIAAAVDDVTIETAK